MKVLGLHGHGTSGSIFRSQTAAFRSKLDPRVTFDFVDAPFEIPPSLGIEVFFRGPYYTFWKSPELNAIREAHAWLLDLIEEQGPYDAVMCFSQGCALISSFLLWHQAETPNAPLPFKGAIFICGGIPLPVVEDVGVHITPEAFEMNMRTGQSLHAKAGALAQKAKALGTIQRGVGLWDDVGDLMHDATGDVEESDVFGLDFTRIPSDLRIKIPTVHIYGAKDPRYPSSLQLVHFCEKDLRRTYDHLGGHDIPRKSVVSEQMAGLVEWVLSEAKGL